MTAEVRVQAMARLLVLVAATVFSVGFPADSAFGLDAFSETTTGRFASRYDPADNGRLVCGNYRLSVEMNNYGTHVSYMRVSSRTRTYQGYGGCPSNLPQAAGELKTRLRIRRLDANENWVTLVETYPIAENSNFSSVADEVWAHNPDYPYLPGGYYTWRAGHEWTPWASYFHVESGAAIPSHYFCRSDITSPTLCDALG